MDVINQLLAGRPALSRCDHAHLPRQLHASMWMAEGGYDAVAEAVFHELESTASSSSTTPRAPAASSRCASCRRARRWFWGWCRPRPPVLENKDALKRRIDEAARHVPLENLCLSPQCGFASSEVGNKLTEDDQKRKLELVAETASEIWR